MPPTPEIELAHDSRQVMRFLAGSEAPSRLEIAEALNINPGVITRYCKELISLGLVTEDAALRLPGRGRPSVPLKINASGAYTIGVAIHLGWTDIVVVNLAGEILTKAELAFTDSAPLAFAHELETTISALRSKLRISRSRFLGFGLAVPGFSTGPREVRHTVERLRSWRNIDLSEILSDVLDGPVWIENDGNASALAEYYRRQSPAASNLFAIHIGYGVGGGCIASGQLFRGEHLNAAEIGSLYPLSEPRPSALDLLKELKKHGFKGETLKALFNDFSELKEVVDQWIKRASKQLELAVNAGVAFYDPAEIVICGMLPNGINQALADHLRTIDWTSRLDDRPLASIRASSLDGMSAAVGAAMIPTHETLF